ncbi:hypothetical protein SAMN04489761_0798 [Tenacibaculum sp. MAR_2009_124]|uniref:hypothetical protein n=1 Tax=Tenacibaculum sp. MAR_2009_124 TaxID=1250059 RepID=UPI00089BCAEB|nr:hypothetical protein [Tenacibaculum sp. MAR_2009_124]SEB45160.1 hypothetical protein SAMN04489761_0798 [Tenacibaculum sp. MAR_2009_124]
MSNTEKTLERNSIIPAVPHNVTLTILNETDTIMKLEGTWFDSGEIKEDSELPAIIKSGDTPTIKFGVKKPHIAAGVSGYVQYKMKDQVVTIAFSNPSVGTNKVGIGISDKDGSSNKIWDKMSNHNYKKFNEQFNIASNYTISAECLCTSGGNNTCYVDLIKK